MSFLILLFFFEICYNLVKFYKIESEKIMEQQKKRWYQKWWGILLMILFWYIAAPIAIYQSKISNTKKIVFASIYLFFVFSFTGMQDNVSTITIGTVTIPSIFLFSEIALLLLIVIALSKNIVYKVKLKKLEEQANKILEVEKMDLIEVKNEKELKSQKK